MTTPTTSPTMSPWYRGEMVKTISLPPGECGDGCGDGSAGKGDDFGDGSGGEKNYKAGDKSSDEINDERRLS